MEIQGMAVVSGYASDLYAEHLKGWDVAACDTRADGATPRREVLWMNPAATHATGLLGRMNDGRGPHAVAG